MKKNSIKKMKKQFLAWGLTMALTIPCLQGMGQVFDLKLAVRAKAAAYEIGKDIVSQDGLWTYRKLAGDKIVLTSSLDEEEMKNREIPASVDDMTVTALDGYDQYEDSGWSFWKHADTLETVVIPEGVTRIDHGVFRRCEALKEVTLPDTVKRLGDEAFYCCESLTGIDLDSVKIIGNETFYGCGSLKEIDISQNVTKVGDRAFAACDSLKTAVDSKKVKSYGEGVFEYSGLTEITLYGGDRVTAEMFTSCHSLEKAQIYSPAESIERSAFEGCEALLYVYAGNALCDKIGDRAFYKCTSLREFEKYEQLPIEIGDYAFYQCTSLRSCSQLTLAYLAESRDQYSSGELYKAEIGQICYPEWAGGPEPSDEEFLASGGKAYGSMEMPLLEFNCSRIGKYAFAESGITCISLGKYNSPDKDEVIRIGKRAFYQSKLKSVVLSSQSEVGEEAFAQCKSLKIFSGNNMVDTKNADTNEAFLDAGYHAFDGTPWLSDHMESGLAFTSDHDILLQTEDGYDFGDLTISYRLSKIADGAFEGNKTLTSITCYAEKIGKKAFRNCTSLKDVENKAYTGEAGAGAFESTPWLLNQKEGDFVILDGRILEKCDTYCTGDVVIPKGIIQINDSAFEGCTKIKSISFEEREQDIIIGQNAFANCSALQKITFPENVKITADAYGMFKGCSALKEIVIPSGWVMDGSQRYAYSMLLLMLSSSVTKVTIHAQDFIDHIYPVNGTTGAEASVRSSVETIELGEEITSLPERVLTGFEGKLLYTSKLIKAGDDVFGISKEKCAYWKNAGSGNNEEGYLRIGDKVMYAWDGQIHQSCLDENGKDQGIYLKGISAIAGNAFQEWGPCVVQLDDTVTSIAVDAFALGTLIVAGEDTYAAEWAQENGFDCVTPEAMGTDFAPREWEPEENGGVTASPSAVVTTCPGISETPAASPAAGSSFSPEPSEKPSETPGTETTEKPSETPGVQTSGEPLETPGVENSGKPSETPGVRTSGEPSKMPGVQTSEKPSETPGVKTSAEPSGLPVVEITEKPLESSEPGNTETPEVKASWQPASDMPQASSGTPGVNTTERPDMPDVKTSEEPIATPSAGNLPGSGISDSAEETMNPDDSQEDLSDHSLWKIKITNVYVVKKGISKAALKLQWNGSSQSNIYYEIYRSTQKDSGYKKLQETQKKQYTDSSVAKGNKYYYKVKQKKGSAEAMSAAASVVVRKSILKPVVKMKGTHQAYIITISRSEGENYAFELRMNGYNHGKWFTTKRYQGTLKKKIIMKRNPGSTTTFYLRLRTSMKVRGKLKKSAWSKTIKYK